MTRDELRAIQAPFKEQYRADPASAQAVLRVQGELNVAQLACRLETGRGATTVAGMHPMAGGDGIGACAAEMLLEALTGCAGVTLCAVATAMNIPITAGTITTEGDVDFRGTLAVDRETPVGFTAIRMTIDLDTPATPEQLGQLGQLAERYCVVAQSLSAAAKPQIVCQKRTP